MPSMSEDISGPDRLDPVTCERTTGNPDPNHNDDQDGSPSNTMDEHERQLSRLYFFLYGVHLVGSRFSFVENVLKICFFALVGPESSSSNTVASTAYHSPWLKSRTTGQW